MERREAVNQIKELPTGLDSRSLTELCRDWETQYRYGSISQRARREALWAPYYSMVYGAQANQPFSLPKEPGTVTRVLLEEGVLTRETDVLEIGCGGGALALDLARYCRSVTALDPNPEAIALVSERCARTKSPNVRPLLTSWNEQTPTGRYDLVISAMCPAVCNLEALTAMEAAGSSCAIVTVMRGSYDKYRRQMMQELGLRPEGMITEALLYLELLQALGREPKVWEESIRSTRQTSLESLLSQFPTYFSIFGIPQEESERYLRDFFARHQEGGALQDETQMNRALILWHPQSTQEGGSR